MSEGLKKLVLAAEHARLGARFSPFAGHEMPVRYTTIQDEHRAVRERVGIFDVSHMGVFMFTGDGVAAAIDRVVTNHIAALPIGKAAYTVMCREDGGIIDDLIVYKLADDRLMVIVNAATREGDWAHITTHMPEGITCEDVSEGHILLAIQGPKAEAVLDPLVEASLADVGTYWVTETVLCFAPEVEVKVARTGYTGEDGFELLAPVSVATGVLRELLREGEPHGIQMIGLGARDTLRLEAKYPLYGSDITLDTHPLEAGLGWVVKWDKAEPFLGQAALEAVKANKAVTRRLRGVVLQGRGVLRPGYTILVDGQAVGTLTSGGPSPTRGDSIGLGYIERAFADADGNVEVEIRGRRLPVTLTRRAFYQRAK